MANEIQLPYTVSGVSGYALIRNATGQIFSPLSGFLNYADSFVADCDFPIGQQGTSMYYTASMPSGIGAGMYNIAIYRNKSGGTNPDLVNDTLIGTGELYWEGSRVIVPYTSGQGVPVLSGNLSGQLVNLLSGNQVQVWSGTQVNLFSGQMSGQRVSIHSGQLSGFAVSIASGQLSGHQQVWSGRLSLASGEIAYKVWDEVLIGSTHNIANSAGRRLRQINAAVIHDGTAQAGANNSITLDTGASSTNEIYDENLIALVGGTGVGQTRRIAEYNGTTKVAIVDRVWEVNPSSDTDFVILADATETSAHHGVAQGGTASTITLAADASSVDDIYKGNTVVLRTSTGAGQSRMIVAYNGTTKVATVKPDWVVNPGSSSVYRIMSIGGANVELIEGVDPGTRIKTIASGLSAQAALYSGQLTLLYSGSMSGQQMTARTILDKSGYVLGGDGLDFIYPESGMNARQTMSINAAALAGQLSGATTSTIRIDGAGVSGTNRITATVDGSGNRTAITLNLPS